MNTPRISARIASKPAAIVAVLVMLAAACSSGGDDAASDTSAPSATVEQIDSASGGVAAEGPINGLVTVQPSFGYGVYAIDGASGEAVALPGIAEVETVDRNRDVILGDGAAYSLGAKIREGQSFAADISIVKIDLSTGTSSALAPLGFDRETDESESAKSITLEGVAGNSVVVRTGTFGEDDDVYRVFDTTSGEETASFATPRYEFESESGSCSGGIGQLHGLSDGRLAGVALGSPAVLDMGTGEIELFWACDEDEPELGDFVTPAQFEDYSILSPGSSPTAEDIDWLLTSELAPERGFVEGGGDLWWIVADVRSTNESNVIVGGLVQFDLSTNAVEAVHSLGSNLGFYLECPDENGSCVADTIIDSQLRYLDGRLVILNIDENGPILIVDTATGDVTTTLLERGDGVDYTSADLLAGDPNAVWLEVRRMTVTKDDDTGRSASGPSYIERLNPQTGAIDLSLATQDIFF